jgi:predicted MPP superfamily phosphohydrolase
MDDVSAERGRIEVTRHQIGRFGDPSGPGLRIVQLSDLHIRSLGRFEETIAAMVADLGADVIVLTGDTIDRPGAIRVLRDFLQLLGRSTPKYAILGNWEYAGRVDLQRLRDVYESVDCRLLVNESVVHERGDARLLVTGLDDSLRGRPDFAAAVESTPAAPNHLLLAHCPAVRDSFGFGSSATDGSAGEEPGRAGGRVPHYMLSGHTHGGQVAILGWAPIRPRDSGAYLSGWYRGFAPELYVSRGLGTSGLPIRLGARPEIALFEWRMAGLNVAVTLPAARLNRR